MTDSGIYRVVKARGAKVGLPGPLTLHSLPILDQPDEAAARAQLRLAVDGLRC